MLKNIGWWLAGWLGLAGLAPALEGNLLPNSSFELGINGRDYQAAGLFEVDSGSGWDGTRSLVATNKWPGQVRRGLVSRMFQAAAGPHTFSFYARTETGGDAVVHVGLGVNPFVCGRGIAGPQKNLKISGRDWRRYEFTADLPAGNGDWYWLSLALEKAPADGGRVWLDALMLNPGAEARPYAPRQPVEYGLRMAGDQTRIYPNTAALPPLEIVAANVGVECDAALEVRVLDFWGRVVCARDIRMPAAAGTTTVSKVDLPIASVGPFRAELSRQGGVIQDELIFSIVPEIANPVLATQYANPSPALRHMYKTLGFRYADSHTAPRWRNIQPTGPEDWQWDKLDAFVAGLFESFAEVQFVLGWEPKWAAALPPEPDSPFKGPVGRKFQLKHYLKFVETFVRRYPRINDYQIFNEEMRGWDPADYVLLLQYVRRTFDGIRPGLRILAPNSYPRMVGWTDGFIAAGGLKFTDVLTQHAYTAGGGSSLDALAIVPKWAHADGNAARPIWNTETALHPYHIMTWYTIFEPSNTGSWGDGVMRPDCHAAEEGAERWAKMYLMQTALGFSRFYAHVAGGGFGSELPRFTHMLQGEPDASRQPVNIAWAMAGNLVGAAAGQGVVIVSPYLTALGFEQGRTATIVLWLNESLDQRLSDQTDPLAAGMFRPYQEAVAGHQGRLRQIIPYKTFQFAVPVADQAFSVMDLFGNPVPVEHKDGVALIPVSRLPLYVRADGVACAALARTLAGGELLGLRNFRAWMDLGRTDAGMAGLLVDFQSAVPRTATVRAAIQELPPGFSVAEPRQELRLPAQQRRRLEFPFAAMGLPLEGAGEFAVELAEDGVAVTLPGPLPWVTAAVRRDIVLDGDLAEWDGIPAIVLDQAYQVVKMPQHWSGPADASARIRCAWDATNLYLAAEITDDHFDDRRRGWGGDAIELFLNLQHMDHPDDNALGEHTRQYFLNPPVGANWPVGEVNSIGLTTAGTLAGRRTPAGCQFEAAIPFKYLENSGFVPRPGAVMGFLPTLCDFDPGHGVKLAWTGKKNEYLDVSTWGRLILLDTPPVPPAAAGAQDACVLTAWDFDREGELAARGRQRAVAMAVGAVRRSDDGEPAYLWFDGHAHVRARAGAWQAPRKRFDIRFRADSDQKAQKPELLWVENLAPGWRYLGRITADGRLQFGVYLHAVPTWELTSRSLVRSDGQWVDARYEWDVAAGRVALFVNNQLEDKLEGVVIQDATADLCVGGSTDENAWFRGGIQRVSIGIPE